MFGRATITLGIVPHSSYYDFSLINLQDSCILKDTMPQSRCHYPVHDDNSDLSVRPAASEVWRRLSYVTSADYEIIYCCRAAGMLQCDSHLFYPRERQVSRYACTFAMHGVVMLLRYIRKIPKKCKNCCLCCASYTLKPRLHDSTCCQTGLIIGCIVYTAGCTTRFDDRLNEQWLFVQTGLTTGCIV